MKIALIAYDFFPLKDGISHTLTNICKVFKNNEDKFYVFNPYHKDKRCFNILDLKEYKFKDVIVLLKNKRLILIGFNSIWNIIKDKKTSSTDKLHIILYFFFRPKILLRTLVNIYNLYPHFKKIDFDIILAGASGSDTLPLVYVLSRIFKKKVISFAHGNEFLIHSKFSIRSYYYKNLDRIILHTVKLKNLILKIHYLNENIIEIIPPGLNLKDYEIIESSSDLRKEFNISDNDFVMLSVGRHVSRKNFDLVIKAVFEIKKIYPDISIKYYLIGSGPYTKNLKKLVSSLDLGKIVIFLGECDDLKRNKFYKLSDLFLMPSIAEKESIEGFGVVFLEANYFKLPVIGAISGGMIESILDKQTGLLIKPNDLHDLVEKILYLFNNEDLRKEMGNIGYKRVINDFNWELLHEKYLKMFDNVLKEI
ncbi:MAG: glycosyltransferase family 4 protein [Candidatus Thorarchaeota archaeon]